MNIFRCPQMTILGRALSMAYRQLGDEGGYKFSRNGESRYSVDDVHHAMEEHRKSCSICMNVTAAALQPEAFTQAQAS